MKINKNVHLDRLHILKAWLLFRIFGICNYYYFPVGNIYLAAFPILSKACYLNIRIITH